MALSVVIPVYNAETNLDALLHELATVLSRTEEPFEAILVEDGSRDGSWATIVGLASRHSWVCGIRMMRNYGQQNALLCGIRRARYPIIVTMDDDSQHPPEAIPALIARLDEDCDIVYGTPIGPEHGFLRKCASRLTRLALRSAMGSDVARHVSAFRAFRTPLREAFATYQGPHVSIDVLLTWATTRFAVVRVPHRPRPHGASNYTVGMLVSHALNMMTGFSTLPLQLASVTGFGFTLFGIAVLVYVLGRYLIHGGSVPGFPFLASVIAIFSGAQLFALGVIGEYLARMHFRMMNRPPYAIRETVGRPADDACVAGAAP